MRVAILVLSILFVGCSVESFPIPDAAQHIPDAASGAPDASSLSDAGTDAASLPDAFQLEDAPTQPVDASPMPDVSSRVDTFATPDAASLPDAHVVAPDAFIAGCGADVFEANETATTATPAASGTGWPHTSYAMTWHDGDAADWIGADLASTGVVGLFRVHASDIGSGSGAMVEVRVTCLAGLTTCRGVGTSRVGATCIGRRAGNAYADVGCNTDSPASVTIAAGVVRSAGAMCSHELSVSLAPASF